MRMLNDSEYNKVRALIEVHIPEYIKNYSDDKFDLMECYEVGFVFAHDLLRNKTIDPGCSPWGGGSSVIFDLDYSKLLQGIIGSDISEEVNNYCGVFLDALDVFRNHFQ